MNIDFNIGISIACVCLFIVSITFIILFGCCETIEEELGFTTRNSKDNLVENPVHNV